ncbi:MAG TPA: copper homeostasis membrane protein CopD [Casimicrobiaceae bacterium]|nr:copper homeostasis membrane protein CopD [Casimicrobiaceae bacterium]
MTPGFDALGACLVGARAFHLCAAVLLFGELLFATVVRPRAPLRGGIVVGTIAMALVSAFAWLALEAIVMSGDPPSMALRPAVMGVVLRATQFGQLWLLRLAVVLIVALTTSAALRLQASGVHRGARTATLFAGCYLALLAGAGHANAASGTQRLVELVTDASHLLAAGAWVGALPALVAALAGRSRGDDVAAMIARFSHVGIAAVCVVLLSGLGNALFRVPAWSALVATAYGQVLLAKLALVTLMLALAAYNRFILTPRLRQRDDAVRALGRSAQGELVAGIVVLVLVAVLGITPPPTMDMGHDMRAAQQR